MNFHYEKRSGGLSLSFNWRLEFPAHLHKEVELVYIKQGIAHAYINGIDCTLNAGDFFIAFPDRVHYYDECKNVLATVIIFSAGWLGGYTDIFYKMQPVCPKIENPPQEAVNIVEILENLSGTQNQEILRGLILSLMGILIDSTKLIPNTGISNSTTEAILSYCEKNYRNEISITDISRNLHISNSYISHIFSDRLHLSFRDYINSLRIADACAMLKSNSMNITEIAHQTGFNTIRTFNRAFKKQYGITPYEYKKRP